MTRVFRFWMLLGACLFVAGCSGDGTWGWYVIDPTTPQGQSNVRFLIGGFWATIQLSLIAALMSMTLGLLVALPGMSTNRWVRLPSRVYIEFVRAHHVDHFDHPPEHFYVVLCQGLSLQ